MESSFTYYEHQKELDKYLMSDKFIDGETYEIHVSGSLTRIHGNFLVNMMIDVSGKWRYRDVIRKQSVPIFKDAKSFLKAIQPLKFKKITK